MPTTDDRADRIAETAAQLVARVRDDQPTDVHRWIRLQVADFVATWPGHDDAWVALAVALACAVPDDRSWTDMTAWTRPQSRKRALHKGEPTR
jgi:hypothetical protein